MEGLDFSREEDRAYVSAGRALEYVGPEHLSGQRPTHDFTTLRTMDLALL